MKILKLVAENVKKLRAVEITPTGELVEITGRNAQGKSSVLDSIWWALAGTTNIQAVPIRKGATKARVRLELGELTIERRFTEKGASTLTVESNTGARYTSPQKMLDALLGALAFDPLAFVHEEPREQFETLRGLVKLDVDVDQLDGLNRRDYDDRTEISRNARALRAQADGIAVRANLPAQPIDTAALMDGMAAAAKVSAAIETDRSARLEAQREIQGLERRMDESKEKATQLRRQAAENDEIAASLKQGAQKLRDKLDLMDPPPTPVDVDSIRQELEAAQETNRQVAEARRRESLLADAGEHETQVKALSETIEARTQTKTDAIAKAAMPVEGLGFGEGVVTFQGIPFDQASSSEQLRVSVAIAMAANPKLRVIRIKEGSLLDPDGLALIGAMAREHDYQIWIERVDASGKVGIVIEDGQVVAVEGQPVKAEA